jgi:hypothetical protein
MIPEPVVLIVLAILIAWAFFGTGHDKHHRGNSGGPSPAASQRKAQEMKEKDIQDVYDAWDRGEIDVKTRNSQVAHLSRLPTNPQDGPGSNR